MPKLCVCDTMNKESYNPVKSSEDLFDVSSLDEDAFLLALEHNTSSKTIDLDVSQKIENIIKQYEESDAQAKATPVKKPAKVQLLHSTPLPKIAEKVGPNVKSIAQMFDRLERNCKRKLEEQEPAEEEKTFSSLTVKEKISLYDNLTKKSDIVLPLKKVNHEKEQKASLTVVFSPTTEKEHPAFAPCATEEEFVFLQPVAPPKKKKTKRTLTWKEEEFIVEKTEVAATDSESDCQSDTEAIPTPKVQDSDLSESVDVEKLIQKLKEVNSDRKVKTAYTLTAMPTPSPRLSTASRFHFSDSMTEPEWDSPARFSIGNSTPLFMKLPDSVFKQSSNSRRSSLTGTSRRSSMNMDVIFEEIKNIEQNMDTIKSQVRGIGRGSSSDSGRTSSFWISYGSFRMALDIQFNASNRLRKCYEIFSEKAAETEAAKLTFGIDNMKFSFDDCTSRADVSRQLTKHRKSSHYWFLAGDLIMPFTGPHLTKERIASMFEFIRSSAGNASDLKFGVDHLEFSKADKKCAWTSTPLKTSDLGSDGFESEYTGSPLRLSPFERRSSIYESNRNSISSFSSFEGVDLLNYEYEHDPVEKIFHARMNRLPGFV